MTNDERIERNLWLWQNGDHFLAFENLFPAESEDGDPLVSGEPVAMAVLKPSENGLRGVYTPIPKLAMPDMTRNEMAALIKSQAEELDALTAENERLKARVEEARQALEPFANFCEGLRYENMDEPIRKWFTVADFAIAKAALEEG